MLTCRALLYIVISYALFAYVINSSPCQSNARTMVMLLDKSAESIFCIGNGFSRKIFNAALNYGKCPIVVSGTILHAWCTYADHFAKSKTKDKKNFLRAVDLVGKAHNPFDIRKLYALHTSIERELQEEPSMERQTELLEKQKELTDLIELSHTSIYNEHTVGLIHRYECCKHLPLLQNYHLYKCLGTHEYLLLPTCLPQEFAAQGLQINNRQILKPLSIEELRQDLTAWDHNRLTKSAWKIARTIGYYVDKTIRLRWWTMFEKINWDKLKQLFVPGSQDWILYLSGHGWYTAPRKQQQRKLAVRCHDFCDINNFFSYVGEQMCCLYPPQHDDLLTFLGSTIKTLALYEETCWQGGYHFQQTIEKLKKLANNKNFTPYLYISNSITESSHKACPSAQHYDFGTFFDKLAAANSSTDDQERCALFKQALKAINADPYQHKAPLATPRIYDPHTQTAQVIDCYDMLYNIKNSDEVDFDVPKDKNALLIYPSSMHGHLNLEQGIYEPSPYIISMIPGQAVHTIASLDADYGFDDLIKHSFFGFVEIPQKTFIIHQLYAENYEDSGFPPDQTELDLEQVIIEKRRHIKQYGFFCTMQKVVGTAYCKLADAQTYYKANIDGVYNDVRDPNLEPFQEISQAEFDKKFNSCVPN